MSLSSEALIRDFPAASQDGTLSAENRSLKARIKQLQSDLQYEQGNTSAVRKKLSGLEKERMDIMSKNNEEVSKLEGEVARLRSQLEKGEANRHSLEYELTKARRDITHEKRYTVEREVAFSDANDTLKAKVGELSDHISRLMDEAEEVRLRHNEERRHLQALVAERDTEISRLHREIEGLEVDRENLQKSMQQIEESAQNLDDKLVAMTDAKREQAEELRRLSADFSHLESEHETLQKEFESASERIRQLEENIEAERASHLETKFNSEIVQLRIRDLESALELEKNTKIEALASSDKLNKQMRYCETYHGDLQRIYDEERRVSQETKEKLEKAEKEYSALSKQLNAELEEKRKVIKTLSEQIESHQKDFTEVKQELSKTKRSLSKLDESQANRLKELEMIYNNFRLDQPRKPCRKMAPRPTDSKTKLCKEPDLLLENLKDTFLAYRKKLSETETEASRLRQQFESVSAESRRLQDSVTAKDRALKNTQTGMGEARMEMNTLQRTNRELERDLKQVQRDLDDALRQFQTEQKNNLEIAEQSSRLISKTNNLEQKLVDTLMAVYRQLCPEADRGTLVAKTPDDLLTLISDQVNKVKADMKWMSEKVEHLEVTVSNKTELAEQLQEAHDEQLRKLGELAEGRSLQWQQHRTQLEEHYTQLLQDIQTRHKKTQALADQAWEKVRMTGSVQQGLERECEDLRAEMHLRSKDQQGLLAACGLLAGALVPLQARNAALVAQKQLLVMQLNRMGNFKKEVQKLSEALKLDHVSNQDLMDFNLVSPTPLIRFRRAVLTVMAAHRLLNFSRGTSRMFVTEGTPGQGQMVVCTGGVAKTVQPFTGFGAHRSQYDHFNIEGETRAALWLRSDDLRSMALTSVSDLVHYLGKNKDFSPDSTATTQLARNAFQHLFDQLTSMFHGVPGGDAGHLAIRDRTSLVRLLGRGLTQAIGSAEEVNRCLGVFEPSSVTLGTLQHQILEFTRRLHTAEIERRDLRIQVMHLSQSTQQLNAAGATTDRVAAERDHYKRQAEESVERSRFQQVCDELNKALQREQDAQNLLKEQSNQIVELQRHIRAVGSQQTEKQHTIHDAVAGLAEAKIELKRQDQRSRQTIQRLQTVEAEKGQLEEHVKDAENALRTAARDKEALSAYIKAVAVIVSELQDQAWQMPDSLLTFSRLSEVEHQVALGPGRKGPEMAACQQLMRALGDLGQQLNDRIEAMMRESVQNKQEIEALKEELGAACKREGQTGPVKQPEHTESLFHHMESPTRAVIGGAINQSNQEFLPLPDDKDVSSGYSVPEVSHDQAFPDPHSKYRHHPPVDQRARSTGRLDGGSS